MPKFHVITVNPQRVHDFTDNCRRVATRLVAHRHTIVPNAWCLSWDFGDQTSVGAEGECSRKLFHTARAARAYGEKHYGERAVIKGDF